MKKLLTRLRRIRARHRMSVMRWDPYELGRLQVRRLESLYDAPPISAADRNTRRTSKEG